MSNWNNNRGYRGDRDEPPRQQQTFPNSGALFPNRNKRSDNSPDLTGHVTVSEEVLDYIIREAERGNEVKLDLSGWMRMSRDNSNFTSLKINMPYDVRMQEQGNPTYRSRPGPQRRDDRQASPQPQRRVNRYSQQSGREEPRGYNERNPPPRDEVPDFMRDDDLNDELPFKF